MVLSPGVRNRIVTGVVPRPIPSTVTRAPAGSLVTMSEMAASAVEAAAGAATGSVGAGTGGDRGIDGSAGATFAGADAGVFGRTSGEAAAGAGWGVARSAGGFVHSCHMISRIPPSATVERVAVI